MTTTHRRQGHKPSHGYMCNNDDNGCQSAGCTSHLRAPTTWRAHISVIFAARTQTCHGCPGPRSSPCPRASRARSDSPNNDVAMMAPWSSQLCDRHDIVVTTLQLCMLSLSSPNTTTMTIAAPCPSPPQAMRARAMTQRRYACAHLGAGGTGGSNDMNDLHQVFPAWSRSEGHSRQ